MWYKKLGTEERATTNEQYDLRNGILGRSARLSFIFFSSETSIGRHHTTPKGHSWMLATVGMQTPHHKQHSQKRGRVCGFFLNLKKSENGEHENPEKIQK